jgi:hypothetical protein
MQIPFMALLQVATCIATYPTFITDYLPMFDFFTIVSMDVLKSLKLLLDGTDKRHANKKALLNAIK